MQTMNTSLARLGLFPMGVLALASACSKATGPAVAPPIIKALTPAESIATMEMPKGYKLEPVLTEPDIAEPVMVAFDGNGRMYVAEMRTYMMDADATGEQE